MPAAWFGTARFHTGRIGRGRIALAALLITVLASSASAGSPAGWSHDFDAARARAQSLERPLLVHFYAEWCAPCKRMDRDVLYRPEFLEVLHRSVVPVKLDVDQHQELARRYKVESVPTDLFLTPEGRVLGMMNGYRPMKDYLGRLAGIVNQFQRRRDIALARSQESKPLIPSSRLGRAREDELPELGERDLPAIKPWPAAPNQTERQRPVNTIDPPDLYVKPRADGTILVGLGGFSPVTLYYKRAWVKGDRQFAAKYQGLTYLMSSAAELATFREHPEQFAPRLLGCDPVLYFDEGQAIPGSTQLAVFYDDSLYLFSSTKTRARFREDPHDYARRRTVLLPSELQAILR